MSRRKNGTSIFKLAQAVHMCSRKDIHYRSKVSLRLRFFSIVGQRRGHRVKFLVPSERSFYKEYTCVKWMFYLLSSNFIVKVILYSNGDQKSKLRLTSQTLLATRNKHALYESSICFCSKVIIKGFVFKSMYTDIQCDFIYPILFAGYYCAASTFRWSQVSFNRPKRNWQFCFRKLSNMILDWWDITPIFDPLLILTLLPNLTFYLIVWGFHRTFATGAACQQRTLTPPDTWSCHTLGLACVLMSRPIAPDFVLFPDSWVSNIPRYFCFAWRLLEQIYAKKDC